MLHIRLPSDRQRDGEGVEGEDVEHAEHPVLVEQRETQEHEAAGEEVGDIESESGHHRLCETNRRRVPSRPSMSAAPRNSGTRKTRILAMVVSNSARRTAPTASLAT